MDMQSTYLQFYELLFTNLSLYMLQSTINATNLQ